jgi:hypothetical protein
MLRNTEHLRNEYHTKRAVQLVEDLNSCGCNQHELARRQDVSSAYINQLVKKYGVKFQCTAYL